MVVCVVFQVFVEFVGLQVFCCEYVYLVCEGGEYEDCCVDGCEWNVQEFGLVGLQFWGGVVKGEVDCEEFCEEYYFIVELYNGVDSYWVGLFNGFCCWGICC